MSLSFHWLPAAISECDKQKSKCLFPFVNESNAPQPALKLCNQLPEKLASSRSHRRNELQIIVCTKLASFACSSRVLHGKASNFTTPTADCSSSIAKKTVHLSRCRCWPTATPYTFRASALINKKFCFVSHWFRSAKNSIKNRNQQTSATPSWDGRPSSHFINRKNRIYRVVSHCVFARIYSRWLKIDWTARTPSMINRMKMMMKWAPREKRNQRIRRKREMAQFRSFFSWHSHKNYKYNLRLPIDVFERREADGGRRQRKTQKMHFEVHTETARSFVR